MSCAKILGRFARPVIVRSNRGDTDPPAVRWPKFDAFSWSRRAQVPLPVIASGRRSPHVVVHGTVKPELDPEALDCFQRLARHGSSSLLTVGALALPAAASV